MFVADANHFLGGGFLLALHFLLTANLPVAIMLNFLQNPFKFQGCCVKAAASLLPHGVTLRDL